jgi:glutaminase
MARKFNHDRAAMVLSDALVMGDRLAAEKWQLTVRSVQKYRERLEKDEQLRIKVKELQQKQEDNWANQIPAVLTEAMCFFKAAFVDNLNNGEGTNKPETIAALTGALETLADIELTRSIVSQRLSDAEG